ncbi:hypothetical protein QJ48_23440 [Paenibacillus sp. A3]|uniref:hypothetical protein n=1 Tax=Paenibacillus sp. A3 TaxID=1337054 RepID=UPI0006D57A5D|nr:hypothetical protein [Paenibacillus sp. A3]KPV57198.1 hypothetical protein QJ48_23440 [Paenibacillus sp. A3]
MIKKTTSVIFSCIMMLVVLNACVPTDKEASSKQEIVTEQEPTSTKSGVNSASESVYKPVNSAPKNYYEALELINKKFTQIIPNKIEEFKKSIEKYENHKSNINLIEAIISGSVFNGYQIIDEETASWITKKQKYLAEQLDSFSLVYSDTSSEGIQFVAIVQPQMGNSSKNYREAIGLLRGDEKEMDVLSDIGFEEPDHYFAVDILAKDLLDIHEQIEITDMYLTVEGDEKVPYVKEKNESKGLQKILNTYNRDVNVSSLMKKNDWNLYLFKDPIVVPETIVIEVKGMSEKTKKINLKRTAF